MKVTLEKFSLEIDQANSTAKISISPQANGNVVIPRSVKYQSNEYLVVGINDDAFRNNTHVRGIIFPRDSAVQIINKFAFCATNIESMILPASVEKICEGAFSECNSLRKISFDQGSKLRTIEKDAFSWSSLDSLNLPGNIKELREGWCNGTSSLIHFSVPDDSRTLSCIGQDFIVGKSKRCLNNFDILLFARRDIEGAVIPPSIRRICSFAFHSCNQLKSIQFTDDSKLRSIDQYAFSWSSLVKINVPDHVKKICQFAFSECPKLQTVEFTKDSQLRVIKEYAFSSSSLESIRIPSHVNVLGKNAFSWCNRLTNVTFDDQSELCSIDKNVFHRTSIASITIPSRVSKIGVGAFSECFNMKSIIFPNDSQLKSIEKKAFFRTSIQSVTMPSRLANLKDGWCWGTTKVFNVQVPSLNKNFGSIEGDFIVGKSEEQSNDYDMIVFARKDAIRITIPQNIKKIAPYAFDQCEKLRFVTFDQIRLPTVQPTTPAEEDESAKSSEEEDQKNLCKAIVLPEDVDDNAFWGCSSLRTAEFLGDQISIGQTTFADCKNLRAITLPNAEIFSICTDSFKGVPNGFQLFIKAGAELVNN
ncbi:hypothetical protein M9Y10_017738 [Tritrichomonas musculus]|uniref:Surface antigen BspA-like n=1 Tax=Tritrichomonas musculus TaxID=1915356 RepID=A0ABR2HUN4_9EUKA